MLALLQEHDALLKATYALLMLVLCPVILRRRPQHDFAGSRDALPEMESVRPLRSVTDSAGRTFTYPAPRQGMTGAAITGAGSFLTGLLGVGIGEVVMVQLVKRNRVPIAVAAATSALIVIGTVASASFTQVTALISAGGVEAIPWNLICYTVPGVMIGGQFGPWLQGRIAHRTMEKAIAGLFAVIGIAMMWIVVR